jgi:hypothetical protein
MDNTQKLLISVCLIGAVVFTVGSGIIPTFDSTIPDGMDAAEYTRQNNEKILDSVGFKITMGGVSLSGVSIIFIIIRCYFGSENQSEHAPENRETRSILKKTRIVPISIGVQDNSIININVSDDPQSIHTSRMTPQHIHQQDSTNTHITLPRRSNIYPPPYDKFNKK